MTRGVDNNVSHQPRTASMGVDASIRLTCFAKPRTIFTVHCFDAIAGLFPRVNPLLTAVQLAGEIAMQSGRDAEPVLTSIACIRGPISTAPSRLSWPPQLEVLRRGFCSSMLVSLGFLTFRPRAFYVSASHENRTSIRCLPRFPLPRAVMRSDSVPSGE